MINLNDILWLITLTIIFAWGLYQYDKRKECEEK